MNILFSRGDQTLDENSENLTLHDLGPASNLNLTCSGVNSIGTGEPGIVELEISGKADKKAKSHETSNYFSSSYDKDQFTRGSHSFKFNRRGVGAYM